MVDWPLRPDASRPRIDTPATAESGDVREVERAEAPASGGSNGDVFEVADGDSTVPRETAAPNLTGDTAVRDRFLARVSPEELPAARALLNGQGFRALAPETREALLDHWVRDPKRVSAALSWTADPGFKGSPIEDQQAFYEHVLTAAALSSGARPLVVNAASQLASDVRPPQNISIVFPGQRARTGRGEMAEAWRRVEQAKVLFPDAKIDLVVFDPPSTVGIDDFHPLRAPVGFERDDWSSAVIDRDYRSVDYIHDMLGMEGPWDPSKQPVIEHNGVRLVYATAPESGKFEERFTVARDSQNRPTHLELPENSLGYRTIQNADLAIVGGAGDLLDPRTLNLGRPNSPRPRAAFQFQEAGFRMPSGEGVTNFDTTLARTPGAVSDFEGTHLREMRERVAELRPVPNADNSARITARTELLTGMLPPSTANALARTNWSVFYAHQDTEGLGRLHASDADAIRTWSSGLQASANAGGPPTTAFVVTPRGNSEQFRARVLEGFGPMRAMDGVDGVTNGRINVVFVPPQPQDRFRGLVAGSSRLSLVTGNNSLADAVAAGTPIAYETLQGVNLGKMHQLVLTAPHVLRSAGYPENAINAFIWSLPSMTVTEDGQTRYAGLDEIDKDKGLFADYKGPHAESVRALYSQPEYALAMWDTMRRAVAVDDADSLRETYMGALEDNPDPRARLVAAALADGSFEGLATDDEFKAWLDSPQGSTYQEVVRQGALTGLSAGGFAVAGAFAARAVGETLGLDVGGVERLVSDVGVGAAVELRGSQYVAQKMGGAPIRFDGAHGRALLASTLTSFPRVFTASSAFALAAQKAGIDPDTFAFDAAVVSGTVAAELGGSALANYARVTGKARLAGATRIGGRVAGWAGVPLLADAVGGAIARGTDESWDYDSRVALLARNVERNGDTDWLGAFMPNAAATLSTDERYEVAARTLIRDSAVVAEQALLSELGTILSASDGAYDRDGYWAIDNWLHNDDTRQALDVIGLARQGTNPPYTSDIYRGLSAIRTREDAERFVREELPQIVRQRYNEAVGDVITASAPTSPGEWEGMGSRLGVDPDAPRENRGPRGLEPALRRMIAMAAIEESLGDLTETSISGITDAQLDAAIAASESGSIEPGDPAIVLMARGNTEHLARRFGADPTGGNRRVVSELISQGLPTAAFPPAGGDLEQSWERALGRVFELSKSLQGETHTPLRRLMQQRLIQQGPERLAQLMYWAEQRGHRGELERLITDAPWDARADWASRYNEALGRLGLSTN